MYVSACVWVLIESEVEVANWVESGYELIIFGSFSLDDLGYQSSLKYYNNSNTKFLLIDQGTRSNILSNYQTILFQEDQGSFMAGVMSGIVSKTKNVGIVGGLPIPPLKRYVNGYQTGVKYICPDCTVWIQYTPTFMDAAPLVTLHSTTFA